MDRIFEYQAEFDPSEFDFTIFNLQIHYSKQGQAFKSQAQSMHMEILQSPWLCELMAFHINMRETKANTKKAIALFDGCSLVLKDGKPSLSCELFDSIKLDLDLTCSICLVSAQTSLTDLALLWTYIGAMWSHLFIGFWFGNFMFCINIRRIL